MHKDVYVSVVCFTYMQAHYLRRALDSFIAQETSFRFEVIVHDDASSDETPDIIHEYQNNYPDIIVPFIRKENQFGQNKPVVTEELLSIIQGKYVAVCEGDDYWSNTKKLEKQVVALDSHPECLFCVHKVDVVSENGLFAGYSLPSMSIKTGLIGRKEFLNLCTEYSFQTSSYMFSSKAWKEYYTDFPAFQKNSPVGDIPIQLFFGQLAPVYYIDESMSCYRRGVPNSSTVNLASSGCEKKIDYAKRMRVMFERFDDYTQNEYHDIIMNRIRNYSATEAILLGKAKMVICNKELFSGYDLVRKVFLLFSFLFPQWGRCVYLSRIEKLGKKNKVI